MLLVIDAGNTDIVYGLRQNEQWIRLWRIPSSQDPAPNLWSYRLLSELLEVNARPADIRQTVISSVVPSLNEPLSQMATEVLGKPPVVVNADIYDQLNIKVSNPQEMGTDLVANAVAAFDRFGQTCLVVDFGTALTFTTIGATGEILGVAIAPGLKTAVYSLFKNTAQLPEVPLVVPDTALGQDTLQAIQAGVLHGYTGMVRHLIDQIKSEVGTNCKVIATGGLSSIIPSLANAFDEIDKQLTLNGLAIIGAQVDAQ
ncbi:MAG: type III pantothenate kinase [Bacteroidota bacterium]